MVKVERVIIFYFTRFLLLCQYKKEPCLGIKIPLGGAAED